MLDSPAVRTLSGYLVARFVQLFTIVIFVAVVSIVVIELLLNLDRMVDFGDGLSGALEYLSMVTGLKAVALLALALYLGALLLAVRRGDMTAPAAGPP